MTRLANRSSCTSLSISAARAAPTRRGRNHVAPLPASVGAVPATSPMGVMGAEDMRCVRKTFVYWFHW